MRRPAGLAQPDVYTGLGLVSERESVHGFLTAWEFVLASAKLHKLPDPAAAARRAIGLVEMTDAQDRRIETYSKGMRQRTRVAAALVHDPAVLLLDEPFNGMDPRQRMHMMELLHGMGDQGRTVLFSSHILEEVEQVSGTVQVIVAGRLAASGDYRRIRRLMTNRPHVFTIRSTDDRRLAVALIADAVGGRHRARPEGRADGPGRRLRHVHPRAAPDRPGRGHPGRAAAALRRIAGERLLLPGFGLRGISMNLTIIRITARALFGRRRFFLLLPVPLLVIGIALLARQLGASVNDWGRPVIVALGFAVVLPVIALVVGTGVLGSEIDDGTIAHILAKPLPRSRDRAVQAGRGGRRHRR